MRIAFDGAAAALATALLFRFVGTSAAASAPGDKPDVEPTEPAQLRNAAPYLPPQCYATTRDARGTHNGCFVCHTTPTPPTYVDDSNLQTDLTFAAYTTRNHWANAFRPPPPVWMSDDEVLAWVRTSNYPRLAQRLADSDFDGFIPDANFRFDADGFDVDAHGTLSGWRAYMSAPTPGMFFPTNGSAGDTFVRLPPAYRRDANGNESIAIYRLNLAILEAYIRRTDIPIERTDERALSTDLDRDGTLGWATRVAFVWPPRNGMRTGYVGMAHALDYDTDGWSAAGLFPRGTEILHTLRYLGADGERVHMAARMKEVRYMRKVRWFNYSQLELAAEAETREKQKNPDTLKRILGDAEHGISTGTGWKMQGFIEDSQGELRPQTFEETAFCIGCHGGVGQTTDSVFSFTRKVAYAHPTQSSARTIAEPRRPDGRGEYAFYLSQVFGGNDYQANEEVQAKFFDADGTLKGPMLEALKRDINVLIVPSRTRALALDRAYMGLVREQRFDRGRDVFLSAPQIQASLVQDGTTGIAHPVR